MSANPLERVDDRVASLPRPMFAKQDLEFIYARDVQSDCLTRAMSGRCLKNTF
jgi:hypothetical protein